MNNEVSHTEFFTVDGTLPADSASYIKRAADDDLLSLTQAGKYSYVLTSSQMGKSSLMIQTFAQLRAQEVKTAIIDFNRIGIQGITVDQWYLSMLSQLQEHLSFTEEPSRWWLLHQDKSYIQRFTNFLGQVVLKEIEEDIVIFVDEIGKTLDIGERLGSIEFGDDFFGGIRAMYNARAHDPEFKRLTFVLLGIASPSDLIKDSLHTPFSVATSIALEDFRKEETTVLQNHLITIFGSQAQIIFDHIYRWTSGHPYFTQKLCLSIVQAPRRHWEKEQIIDRWITELFQKNGPRQDDNLKWVEKAILQRPDRDELLRLYKQVYEAQKVPDNPQIPDEPQSIIHNHLKLSGLVKVENGDLHLRNRIYKLVFDLRWIERNSQKEQIEDKSDEASLLEALLILLDSLSRYRVRTVATLAILIAIVFFAREIISPSPEVVIALPTPITTTPFITISPSPSATVSSEVIVIKDETATATIIPTSTATSTLTPTETRTPTLIATEIATPTLTPSETATATQTSVPSTEISTVQPITPSQTEVQHEDQISSESPTEVSRPTDTPVTPPVAIATQTPVTPPVAAATQTPVPPPVAAATQTPVPPPVAAATQTPVTPPVVSATQTPVPPPVATATQRPVTPPVTPSTATPMSPTAIIVPSPTTSPTTMNFIEVTRDPTLIEATETATTAESEITTKDGNGGSQSGGSTEPSQPSTEPTEEAPEPVEEVPDPPESVPDPPESVPDPPEGS